MAKEKGSKEASGLPPIFDENSKVLVLGTFPSEESRATGQYYSTKNNRFWKEIAKYAGVDLPSSYDDRVKLLKQQRIAVWDLIESCKIVDSDDKTIQDEKYNDLEGFLKNTNIDLLILNGKTYTYRKHFKKHFKGLTTDYVALPSTSAGATDFDSEMWQTALLCIWVPFVKAIKHYIKICGNDRLYKSENGRIVLDENYAFPRTCVECNITAPNEDKLRKAIVEHIKTEKL